MRIFISADIEGIAGVSSSAQLAQGPDYGRMRKFMTEEVNAAISGAFAGGATAVTVNDGHGSGTNILIEDLDSRARLISGSNLQLSQMGGIDSTFDAVFFVGHHSMEGTANGVINHIYLGRTVNRITMNGRPSGEMGINGAIAGHYGVPVVLATSDDKGVAEALSFFPGIETVITKRGLDRFVADSLTPTASRKLICAAAEAAVKKVSSLQPLKVELPVTFEVEFKTTAETTFATLFPCVKLTGPKSVSVTAEDVVTGFKMLWGVLELGRAGA